MAAILNKLGLGSEKPSKLGAAANGGISGGLPSNGPSDVAVDRLLRLTIILRLLQLFFALVALCIAIALSSFQKKWISSISGLTGLLLFVTVFSLVCSLVLVLVPLLNDRVDSRLVSSLYRTINEARVGLIVNGFWAAFMLLVALTQTISSFTVAGCKDPAKDKHAGSSTGKKEDYINALPGFCRSKRAEAAFCWFLWASWGATLLLFLHQWRLTRKNGPRIPPFTHPNEDSAFEPIQGDDIDEDDRVDYGAAPGSAAGAGPGGAAGGRYGDGGDGRYGNAYDQYGPVPGGVPGGYSSYDAPSYGTGRPSYERPPVGGANPNPFSDAAAPPPRPSYDYGAYASSTPSDPYSAIQAQLHGGGRAPHAPPQLPQLASYR